MTEEQFISILPLFRGTVKQARKALAQYPEIKRIDIGVIRKILGYSGEATKLHATPEVLTEMIDKYRNGEGTLRGLAKEYRVAPKTFQRALHKAGFRGKGMVSRGIRASISGRTDRLGCSRVSPRLVLSMCNQGAMYVQSC